VAASAIADEPEAPAAPVAAAAAAPAAAPAPAADAEHHSGIEDIEGIGPEEAAKLAAVGVTTTGGLLATGAKPAGRDEIAAATGISSKLILEWVNHADLMRIKGVGSEYSDLLEAAGVDSPAELAQRNPANLAITVQEVVAARPGIVRRVPTESEIAGWIQEAGQMDKIVEH
jgi:predicted flap endonuclease-1-like 5' DNA nuclease